MQVKRNKFLYLLVQIEPENTKCTLPSRKIIPKKMSDVKSKLWKNIFFNLTISLLNILNMLIEKIPFLFG